MKLALQTMRRPRILPMLETLVTGLAVGGIVSVVVTVVHSGLLMVE